MRNLAAWTILSLALLCGGSAAPAGTPDVRPGRQLLVRLMALADSGRMTDSAYVAKALQMKFVSHATTMAGFAEICAPGYEQTPGTATAYDSIAPLGPTSFGRASITRPGFGAINAQPTEISGATKVHYVVIENHDCSGYVQSHHDIEVNLEISPLPGFDCISDNELLSWSPQITRGYATDGAVVYYYASERTYRHGTRLTFESFVGTPCILGISLSQRPRDSSRYQAAQQKQRVCMLPHEQEFCRSHKPFGWGDGSLQDEMASFGVRKCGTLDSFIAMTPENAKPGLSAASADPLHSTPCSAVNAALRNRRDVQ